MFPQPVQIGAPMRDFPGLSFNELVRQFYRSQAKPNGKGNVRNAGSSPSLTMMVKNSSGAAREPGQVLGIGSVMLGYSLDPSQVYRGGPVIGYLPTAAAYANKFCVCKDHIADGAIGSCWFTGCDWVKVNVTDTSHEFAKVADSESAYLSSSSSGPAQIIYKQKQGEDGSAAEGVQWALVLLGGGSSTSNVTRFAVVIDSAGGSSHGSSGISFGTTGTCILLDETGAKSSVDSADEIEFKSAHRVDIITDTIIQLSAPHEIIPGSEWDDNPVIGQFVDSVDELFQLTGFGAQTSLSVPEDGTDAEDIQWLGGECEEE